MKYFGVGSTAFALVCSAVIATAQAAVPNYHPVNSNLSRGGRPDSAGLRELARAGIRTVINLEDEPFALRNDERVARQLGMNWIAIPMDGTGTPKDESVLRALNLLQSPKLFPIFIHCRFGEDRTGLIVGLYRFYVDHWKPEQAYQEMLQRGFHPSIRALDRYFRARTGLKGRIQEEDFLR